MLDITYDPNAHSFKSFYNSTPGDFDESRLTRVTLSNPQTAGLDATAAIKTFDTAEFSIEFPVTQDQYQFAGMTGHYWMAASRAEDRQAFPLSMIAIVKYDVESDKTTHVWEPEGLHMGEPYFVPKAKGQGPMNDDGAIVVVAMNTTGNLFGAILDATDLTELALFEIPMAPVPSFGLHNFYSTASTWVSIPTKCDLPPEPTNPGAAKETQPPIVSTSDDTSSSTRSLWSTSMARSPVGLVVAMLFLHIV